ncbi:zinc ribbon domain-containing protein [Sinomonas halotolerans]|uniref:C4-type zinc ribbon domain-containing protein n=1 Tax=Sinomonas halotolerans TaxID=1644133 RepID=A0ABU9WZU7_9MICC
MPKAPAAEQLKLLGLASLDARLHSLDVRRKDLEADPRVPAAQRAFQEASEAAARADDAVAAAERELSAAEEQVSLVGAKIARDEERLYAGGLSKDLEALQKDIASLTARRSDLEDVELEVLERLDGLREEQSRAAASLAQAESAHAAVRSEIDTALAGIASEHETAAAERSQYAAGVDSALVEVYERTLAKRGVGAARLFHGMSEGSGMDLSPGDLATIRSAAEDEIVFCPDSGCILVRSPEWS